MITVHIAGKPENLLQKCFRCNRVLIDNRRVRSPEGKEGELFYWEPGAFVGAYDGGRNGSGIRERDADESNPDEQACECPPIEVDGGPPVAVYQ